MPGRALTGWLIGLTLCWALRSTLWMPWLDDGKSYRSVFEKIPFPKSHTCVASIGLGESERAMLDCYADKLTVREERAANHDCNVLFVQGYSATGVHHVRLAKWELMWSGARPGDTWQRFWLFKARS